MHGLRVTIDLGLFSRSRLAILWIFLQDFSQKQMSNQRGCLTHRGSLATFLDQYRVDHCIQRFDLLDHIGILFLVRHSYYFVRHTPLQPRKPHQFWTLDNGQNRPSGQYPGDRILCLPHHIPAVPTHASGHRAEHELCFTCVYRGHAVCGDQLFRSCPKAIHGPDQGGHERDQQ